MTNKERFNNLMQLGDFCVALANREGNRLREAGEENMAVEGGFCNAVQAAASAYKAACQIENNNLEEWDEDS